MMETEGFCLGRGFMCSFRSTRCLFPREPCRYEMRFEGWQVYANKSPDLDGVTNPFCSPLLPRRFAGVALL